MCVVPASLLLLLLQVQVQVQRRQWRLQVLRRSEWPWSCSVHAAVLLVLVHGVVVLRWRRRRWRCG